MSFSFTTPARPTSAASQQNVTTLQNLTFEYTDRGSAASGAYDVTIGVTGSALNTAVQVEFETSIGGSQDFIRQAVYRTGTAVGDYTFQFFSAAPSVRVRVNNLSTSTVTADIFESRETEDA